MNETADSGFAVLRTRLPYVDRRVLSEAWFSALHLARDAGSAPPAAAAGLVAPAPQRAASSPAEPQRDAGAAAQPNPAAPRAAARATPPSELGAGVPERPGPAPAERAAVAPVAPGGRVRAYVERGTSLTVGVAGSRVQLLFRRQGAVLHVVALCRPHVAETVGRALAGADVVLRLRGELASGSVRVAPGEVRA